MINNRVKIRLPGEKLDDVLINEYVTTATDRIKLRLGTSELPAEFESIVVDVAVKMHRRNYYEGISSEGADTFSTSFVEDLLNEYTAEFERYKEQQKEKDRLVRFL